MQSLIQLPLDLSKFTISSQRMSDLGDDKENSCPVSVRRNKNHFIDRKQNKTSDSVLLDGRGYIFDFDAFVVFS